uniref:REF/SRPP-like protein At3g05500 n=1 Tax=Rhizophora mucronata TaxID=61149 RepID=A0A2P2IN95_RHIMU
MSPGQRRFTPSMSQKLSNVLHLHGASSINSHSSLEWHRWLYLLQPFAPRSTMKQFSALLRKDTRCHPICLWFPLRGLPKCSAMRPLKHPQWSLTELRRCGANGGSMK